MSRNACGSRQYRDFPLPCQPGWGVRKKMAKEGEDDEHIQRRRGQLTATAALPIRGAGYVGGTFGNYSTGRGQIRVDPAVDMTFAALTTGLLTQAQNIAHSKAPLGDHGLRGALKPRPPTRGAFTCR